MTERRRPVAGMVLLGTSPGMCEEVDKVLLEKRTITVVFERDRKSDACTADLRVVGLRLQVDSRVDRVTAATR